MLIAKYNLDIDTALLLDKALTRITKKNEDDDTRYAENTGGSYAKLSKDLQELFFDNRLGDGKSR